MLFPLISTAVGLIIGVTSSQNPIVAIICGGMFGFIAWALTGFKVDTQKKFDKPESSLSDEELVASLKGSTGTRFDNLTVEAVKRQKYYEEKQSNIFKQVYINSGMVITDKDFEQAELGNMNAQVLIGASYLSGENGLPQNLYKAGIYLLKAAEQGHGFACISMAMLCIEGMGGVTQSADNARIWAVKAKALGIKEADMMLTAIDAKKTNLP